MFSWPRKGSQSSDGGKIDQLNLSILFLVLFFNVVNQIEQGKDLVERIIYTAPFVVIIIILLIFWGNKTFTAVIFLILAVGNTVDPNDIASYSGTIFFIFSFHLIKKQWYAVFIATLSISCLTVRAILANDTIPGTLIMIAVFFYIYAIYYFLIYKDSEKPVRIRFKELNKEEKKLLKLMAEGHSQKTAGAMITTLKRKRIKKGLSVSQTSELVKDIRGKVGYGSLYQVLYQSGINKDPISKSTK